MHIFPIMNIKVTKILTIVIVSSVIGMIYNYTNPSGLMLMPKEKELKWASDSVLIKPNIIKDTIKKTAALGPISVNKGLLKQKGKVRNETKTKETGFGEKTQKFLTVDEK